MVPHAAPQIDTPVQPADPGVAPSGAKLTPDQSSAFVNVSVPTEAKIYVNGYLTKIEGSKRRFESQNLKADRDYTFEVRAEVTVDGDTLQQTKTVVLRAGHSENLAFDFGAEDPITVLSLNNQ